MLHLKRLQKDVQTLVKEKESLGKKDGVFFWWNDADMTEIYLMIVGGKDTPYAGGYYMIRLNFTDKYPFSPPAGKFLTMDTRKKTRLHPNLYACGKICLSILGTWSGPSWQPTLNCKAIALQIASILTANPLKNEPGNEGYQISNPRMKSYSDIVKYENILVTVIDQLNQFKNEHIEKSPIFHFGEMMHLRFLENYDTFLANIEELRKEKLEGTTVSSPCYGINTTFKLDNLEKQVKEMKPQVEKWLKNHEEKKKAAEEVAAAVPSKNDKKIARRKKLLRGLAQKIKAN